jgi:hypothetical protein
LALRCRIAKRAFFARTRRGALQAAETRYQTCRRGGATMNRREFLGLAALPRRSCWIGISVDCRVPSSRCGWTPPDDVELIRD